MPKMITKQNDLLGTLIHDVAHLLRLEIDTRLRPYNLTRAKWLALGILQKNDSLSQSELAAKMELGAASVGRLVDRLVARGFATRVQDPTDRRSYRLQITESAREMLVELDGVPDHLEREMLDDLNEREIKALTHGMSKLKQALTSKVSAVMLCLMIPAHRVAATAQFATEYGPAI